MPGFEDHRTYESPEQLANFTVDDSPVFFETNPEQPAFDAILVFPDCGILQFYFVQFSLSIEHDLKGKAFVDALAAVPSNSTVRYLRVSDAAVDRLQNDERRTTKVNDASKKNEKLYLWYSEIIAVLNGDKDALSRAKEREAKVKLANGDERFSDEKRAPLDKFLKTVRDFTFTQEEMRIEIPDRLPSSSPATRVRHGAEHNVRFLTLFPTTSFPSSIYRNHPISTRRMRLALILLSLSIKLKLSCKIALVCAPACRKSQSPRATQKNATLLSGA